MMEDGLILSQSEYEHLLEEIHKLQARITELTALRDDLVYHVCPALQAEYDEKIVSLERELMAANMYLKQMQRTVEILQAQMNQQQEPSMEEAEAQAKKENKEYEDDLNRKAEEAREFKKKWEESQWSKHDRQEKEAREKEQKEKEQKGKETGEDKDRLDGEKDQDGRKAEQDGSGRGNTGAGDQGDGGSEKSNHGGDSSGGSDEEKEPAGKSKKEETITDKIKRLYRKIVKRLHPDVHPNLTEHEKELWNRAVKAQQEGDLAQLEKIWDELSGMDAPEDVFDDTPEGRVKLRELLEKLKVRLRLLELEIDHIKADFPYKLKSFLEDPVAVEEVRRGIQSKIDNVREMNRQLEAFINELKEKLRKGEKL